MKHLHFPKICSYFGQIQTLEQLSERRTSVKEIIIFSDQQYKRSRKEINSKKKKKTLFTNMSLTALEERDKLDNVEHNIQ